MVDIDYMENCIRGTLNANTIINQRGEFWVGVTNPDDGVGYFLDAKKAVPDIIYALKASMAVPGLYDRKVRVNNKDWVDGTIGFPCPIKEVIKKFNPTDILLITNCGKSDNIPIKLRIINRIYSLRLHKYPSVFRKATLSWYERFLDDIHHIQDIKNDVNIGIIWSEFGDGIYALSTDKNKLKAAVIKSVRNTLIAFGKPKIHFELL